MTIDIDRTPAITVTARHASQIAELLACCDAFLRQASEPVRTELRRYLADNPQHPEVGWLLDMLGFDALFLQAKLAVPTEREPAQRGASS